jgi:hypothetical protein
MKCDSALADAARELHLPVLAHADDVNIGSFLFAPAYAAPSRRQTWMERWNHPENPALVERICRYAAARDVPLRAANLAWFLSQKFPVVAIVSFPSFLSRTGDYECGSLMRLSADEVRSLRDAAR